MFETKLGKELISNDLVRQDDLSHQTQGVLEVIVNRFNPVGMRDLSGIVFIHSFEDHIKLRPREDVAFFENPFVKLVST